MKRKPLPLLTSFVVPWALQEEIVRMIRRNEKRPLQTALATLQAQRGGDRELICDRWYEAACHKNGASLVEMLVRAGVTMGSDKPLALALNRELADVAHAMINASITLSAFDPAYPKDEHVLCLALQTNDAVLAQTLCTSWMDAQEHQGKTRSQLANTLLAVMAGRLMKQQTLAFARSMVAWLVEQGANPNARSRHALPFGGDEPVLAKAAGHWNVPVMQALIEAGACPAVTWKLAPYGFTWTCQHRLAEALRDFLERKPFHTRVLPMQWDAMTLLCEHGVEPIALTPSNQTSEASDLGHPRSYAARMHPDDQRQLEALCDRFALRDVARVDVKARPASKM